MFISLILQLPYLGPMREDNMFLAPTTTGNIEI